MRPSLATEKLHLINLMQDEMSRGMVIRPGATLTSFAGRSVFLPSAASE